MRTLVGLAAFSGLLVLAGCGDGSQSGGGGDNGAAGTTGDAGQGPSSAGSKGSGKAGNDSGSNPDEAGASSGGNASSTGGAPGNAEGGTPSNAEGGTPSNAEAGADGNPEGGAAESGGSNMGGTRNGGSGSDAGGSSSGNGGSSGAGGGAMGGGANAGGSANAGGCENKNDGTPCGDSKQDSCNAPDSCYRGTCVPNFVDAGTACGNAPLTECDEAWQCDGAGQCKIKFKTAGAPCGNQKQVTACDLADECDGSGSCEPNLADFGTPCGNKLNTECNHPDFCDGDGSCDPGFETAGKACGSKVDSECDNPDTCNGTGACQTNREPGGTSCGNKISAGECDKPDMCNDAGSCDPNYVAAGTACGSPNASTCDLADSCSGQGLCSTNPAPPNTVCEECPAGVGQCDGCSSGSCSDSTLCPNGTAPLTTAITAVANHQGIMFDMTATESVTLRGLDVNLATGTHSVNIYVAKVAEGYAGIENTMASWKLLKTYDGIVGSASATAISLPRDLELTLQKGETRGFFITLSTGLAQRVLIGTSVGTVHSSDSNLQIKEGVSKGSGGFAGPTATPRVFSGTVHYTRSVSTDLSSGNAIDGVMFDVDASKDTRIRGIQVVPAGSGSNDVELWYRSGTHVGHENTQSDWVLVDAYAGVTMQAGVPLRLPIVTDMIFEAGTTHGLYVTTGATGELRAIIGSATGAVMVSDSNLTVHEGTGKFYPFGSSFPNRRINATIEYDSCP